MPASRDGFPRFLEADVQAAVQAAVARASDRQPPNPRLANRLGQGIVVAVIDTWPVGEGGDPFSAIAAAAARAESAGREAQRLHDFAGGALPGGFFYRDMLDPADPSPECNAPPGADHRPERDFAVADHGLFIADIIADIAPKAELRVYRAMNDHGVGDMMRVAAAIEQALLDAAGRPLIINCSLGFAPELVLLEEFLATDQDQPGSALHAYEDGAAFYRRLAQALGVTANATSLQAKLGAPELQSLTTLFAVRESRQALVVAAAGNDSRRDSARPSIAPPRVPAAIEGVLGVSAMAPDGAGGWKTSVFSNENDILDPPPDGIAAYGGDATPSGSTLFSHNGLVGLYTSVNLTTAGNYWGRARWSGTSFATPVVAGIAACVWSELLAAGGPPAPSTVMDALVASGDTARRIPLRQRIGPT